jgi:hypothetical protein
MDRHPLSVILSLPKHLIFLPGIESVACQKTVRDHIRLRPVDALRFTQDDSE